EKSVFVFPGRLRSLRCVKYKKISLLLFASALQQDVQVKLGDNVTLQCQITTEEIISVLKWSRADLNTDGYVYFYRNKRSYENYQHQSFHGRVKLRDPEMKDGDVSLILKNVTFNDTGIYECHVAVRKSGRSKRDFALTAAVFSAGETHESVRELDGVKEEEAQRDVDDTLEVGTSTTLKVAVAAAVGAAVLGFAALWRFKRSKSHLTEADNQSERSGVSAGSITFVSLGLLLLLWFCRLD
uniref:Ig-like domain-containing protein n=1 Tax=Oreochromis aureus TaxID=47969 RepID=A0A668VIR4_OREAU